MTYNSGEFLREAIDSILSQQFTDFELLIGDDASTDNTWQIAGGYDDPRIRKYRNETNLGEYANRSKAIGQATGRYLIFIDGDDRMYDHALSVFNHYISLFPEAAMFFCREWDPRILCPFEADPLTIYRFEYLDGGIMGGNFTNVLFRTDVLKAYAFRPDIRSGDTYIQLKIAQRHTGVVIPSGLTWWRRRKGNATQQLFSDYRHLAESLQYRAQLLQEDCPLPELEVEQALVNLYGVYMRTLLRLLLRGHFSDLAWLLRKVGIPGRYRSAVFKPSKLGYFSAVSGDQPLHTVHNK